MKYIFLILTICAINAGVQAQTAEDSIKTTINTLFDGMRASDTASIRGVFAGNAVMQTITNANGNTKVRTDGVSGFILSVAAPHTEVYDERMGDMNVLLDGDMAAVWCPYQFYIGERFSHCGVNAFTMVRYADGWKIQYVIDTRRKAPCR